MNLSILLLKGEDGKLMPNTSNKVVLAHKHSSHHREELERSESCGCFYCLAVFKPDEIQEWIDEGSTALCPKCSIDSVIGSASGYPIDEKFLAEMERHWFGLRDSH